MSHDELAPGASYAPAPGVYAGRPPCAHCGAAYRLHGYRGLGQRLELCPVRYRPPTLEVAQRELAAAVESGDEARVFVARGEVQRLVKIARK